MFKIRIIQNSAFPASTERIEQVRDIFQQCFPTLSAYRKRLPSLLDNPLKHGYTTSIFAAERSLGRIQAFALFMHFPKIKASFLDFIAVRPDNRGGGIGGALYEAVREYCRRIGSKGLYMEVQPDDPALTPDPDMLKESRKRIRFYEKYGARPIWGTQYATPVGDPPTTAYLLYDGLGSNAPLRKAAATAAVEMILTRRFGHVTRPSYVKTIVNSFNSDPVLLRSFKYRKKETICTDVTSKRLDNPFALVSSPMHKIHHVPEKGYFEKPVRVDALIEALTPLPLFSKCATRRYGEKPILAVHDTDFVHYLRTVCSRLRQGRPVYPDTFPIRRPEKRPKELPVQAGFYCLDSGTPLYRNAYVAATRAVDTTLTAADEILAGRRIAYAVCRPPGHHAGRKFYGGFCYFNNAAIAAHYLSAHARICILDIDFHHGNGTQDIFYERSDVVCVSIHGHPDYAYPYFSGYETERGAGSGIGANFNFPLKPQTGGEAYLKTFRRALTRVVKATPGILVISLGFDILAGDPTGTFQLAHDHLREIGRLLASLKLPLLIVQEGGYNIRNIRKGAVAFFHGISQQIASERGLDTVVQCKKRIVASE